MSQKATLVIHQKLTSPKGLVSEISVWRVPETTRYPDSVKYRLVLVDPRSHEVLLLFDNHHPKGPHKHQHGRELEHAFAGVVELVSEFREEAAKIERSYRENKENQD